MINFRYHVVSLTAVFLALAIGLVVGTAALNGPVADMLNNQVNAVSNQNKELRERVNHLTDDVNSREDFAAQAAPYMLDSVLAGRRVVVVSLPSASSYVEGVVEMLTVANARVTARVEIQDKFTDPANKVTLLDLAHAEGMPPTVSGLPRNSDGVETSSALLAAVLLDHTPSIPAADVLTVLTTYQKEGYLLVKDATGKAAPLSGPAEVVVLVAGAPYFDREADAKNDAVVTLVAQFDAAGPIVVAGSGVGGEGNVVADVRKDPALSKTVSTVDNVPTVQGRVATALVTLEQIQLAREATVNPAQSPKRQAGHYGQAAETMLPKSQQ